MRLWTEYEGETIDGAFPLKQLLLPEGRSAFFSTANGKGDPALLRLIECHFDEDEIIARWRCIEALCHPNFLKLERYGQIELDGGPGVYALFEKADANLAEVLAQDRLTVKDTAQLAGSLVAALEMLHTHGFVHEHVAAQSIFAVGETVKLRSDCIREAPEGQAGLDAKQCDVHDLAVVVLQALTLTVDVERASGLPVPFDKVVRYGVSGAWGLADIRTALAAGPRASPAPAPAKMAQSAPKTPVPGQRPAKPTVPHASPAVKPVPPSKPVETSRWDDNLVRSRMRQVLQAKMQGRVFPFNGQGAKWAGVATMIVILALMAGWLVAHVGHRGAQPVPQPAASASPRPVQRPVPVRAEAGRTDWRVVAYTYNHRDQAQKKAAALAKMHADLRPEVFTPTRHAPFLVTIGGAMNRDEALAFAGKARSRGLPRDTYAQNYTFSGR